MPQSVAFYTNAMKENYGPGLRNAVNNNNVVWGEVATNTADIIGTEAVWSIHTGRSSSTSARKELVAPATADRQKFQKARRGLASIYHTVKISGQVRHLTSGNEGAFASSLDTEVKGADKDLKNEMARETFGQGVSIGGVIYPGIMATLSADPGTGTTLTMAAEDSSIMRHFFIGMKLDVLAQGSGAVVQAGLEVTAINVAARTLTIGVAADAAIASGDFICRTGNFDAEIDGLRFLLGTQTYAGINPATVPAWQAVQVGSTTTGISEVLLDEAIEGVQTDGDGSTPELFVCEHKQRRKLASMLQAQKRYEGREMTLTSGWKGLALSQGVLVADRYCPTTRIFGLTKTEMQRFVGLDFQWDEDDDGGVFYKALDGTDATEARFKGYTQLATVNRNSHVQIRVAEPTF